MAVKRITVEDVIAPVRMMIIDRVVTGKSTSFSDDEIVMAFNHGKSDLWGKHPASFSDTESGDLIVTEPADATQVASIFYIYGWAYSALILYISAWLMQMKSKDKYYRKAHVDTMKEYEGMFK